MLAAIAFLVTLVVFFVGAFIVGGKIADKILSGGSKAGRIIIATSVGAAGAAGGSITYKEVIEPIVITNETGCPDSFVGTWGIEYLESNFRDGEIIFKPNGTWTFGGIADAFDNDDNVYVCDFYNGHYWIHTNLTSIQGTVFRDEFVWEVLDYSDDWMETDGKDSGREYWSRK